MKHIFFLFVLLTSLTSCATILTGKYYCIDIYSNANNSKVQILDSTYNLPAKIKIERSKSDLQVQLQSDSQSINYTIKASPHPAFLYGNLLWMEFSPAAYLIDFTNQKRFFYGNSIYLDLNDTNRVIRLPVSKCYYNYLTKTYPENKGQINLVFSLPYINSFYLQPQNEMSKANTGFWGISLGLEYFYNEKNFLSINTNAVSDFFLPFPAAVDISGEYEIMSSLYLSMTNNYKFRRFTLGYGLNYSKNIWDLRYYDWGDPPPPIREPIKKTSQSIGFTLNGYHQFVKHFFIGLIYRPSILKVNPNVEFKYEHLISLDFEWKLRLKK